MSRTNRPLPPQSTAPSLASEGTSVPLQAKVAIVEAAIAEKKAALEDIAAKDRFSFDRACQALDVLAELSRNLPGRYQERFVAQVALPLVTREALPLLKICLSSKQLHKINELCDGLPTLLVEHPLRQLSEEITSGRIDSLTKGKILPIRSHALIYLPVGEARPYRALMDKTMHSMAEFLDASPFVQTHQFDCFSSTTCLHVQRRCSPNQRVSESTSHGHISLVLEPSTNAFDLATSLLLEDQRARFEKLHGLCQPREVVPDTYRQRTLTYRAPLVEQAPSYPSLLLKEFRAYTAGIIFKLEAVSENNYSGSDLPAIRTRTRRELVETLKAEALLTTCIQRRDFNTHGIELFSACQEALRVALP